MQQGSAQPKAPCGEREQEDLFSSRQRAIEDVIRIAARQRLMATSRQDMLPHGTRMYSVSSECWETGILREDAGVHIVLDVPGFERAVCDPEDRKSVV